MSSPDSTGQKEAQKRISNFFYNPSNDLVLDLSGLGLRYIPEFLIKWEYSFELNSDLSLDLSSNKISKIENMMIGSYLSNLNLSFNEITRIENLGNCTNLSVLNLEKNKISKIDFLNKLKNLNNLNLSGNLIGKIENVDKLSNLEILDISFNDIAILENLSELKNLTSLDMSHNKIARIEGLDKLINLKNLDFSENELQKIENLEKLNSLSSLQLLRNKITKIENFDKLVNLKSLSLFNNKIKIVENLDKLIMLINLQLNFNDITKIENFNNLQSLRSLSLTNNSIEKIENLDMLLNLSSLSLSDNGIEKIENLDMLLNLTRLFLSNNIISKIENLKLLVKLTKLDLDGNEINVDGVGDLEKMHENLKVLKAVKLKIHKNEFLHNVNYFNLKDYSDNKRANHVDVLLNDIELALIQQPKISYKLPSKVILIGNSSAGKSSLVEFLKNGNLQDGSKNNSTEALEISPWKVDSSLNQTEVFFYDFGGQDYYHSSYRLFMSDEATYLLVWSQNSNSNNLNFSSVEDNRSRSYHNFNVPYWLGNIGYLVDKQISNDQKRKINIHLIENKSDLVENGKATSFLTDMFTENFRDNIGYEFKISLWHQCDSRSDNLRRELLKESLQESLFVEEKFYKHRADAFKEYIENWKEICCEGTYWRKTDLVRYLKEEYITWRELDDVEVDLILGRFMRSGMLLWYRYDYKLKDKIWIKPGHVQERIRELLNKNFGIEGIVDRETFEGHKLFSELGDLLLKQQVVFKDETKDKTEYIIPQSLPLNPKDDVLYSIAIDGLSLIFSLKFQNFMPIGIMNRLICLFGKNPEKKSYSRYEMIFTYKQKHKVRLKCNMVALTLEIYMNEIKEKLSNAIIADLFQYCLVAYHGLTEDDLPPLSQDNEVAFEESIRQEGDKERLFEELKNLEKPEDLMISLDGRYYALFRELQNISQNPNRVTVHCHGNSGNIYNEQGNNDAKTIEYPAYRFNPFIEKKKPVAAKLFISYAHKDFEIKNRLLTHLKVMKRQKLVEIWDDGMIMPGEYWDDRIIGEIERCDIFVMLLSPDFLASEYIWKRELDKFKDTEKKCFIILLGECDYKFTFLEDYEIIPALDEKGKKQLTALSDWNNLDSGIKEVVKQLRLKIETIQEEN